MNAAETVLGALRVAHARSHRTFVEELQDRVRQLAIGNMVDGRVLPRDEVHALLQNIVAMIRGEVLPHAKATDARRVIDLFRAYRVDGLEDERARIEAEKVAAFRPPPPLDWPEIAEIRALASPPAGVADVAFVADLEGDGLPLPPELVRLHATFDGFDLSCLVAPHVPVFSLLPQASIDVSEAEGDFARRAIAFQGGDEVQLGVHRDSEGRWWLVYEHEYEPTAKQPFDLRALLSFGVRRARARDLAELDGDLSWDAFFRAPSSVAMK